MARATLLIQGARCSTELNMSEQINTDQGILQQIPNLITQVFYFVPAKKGTNNILRSSVEGTVCGLE